MHPVSKHAWHSGESRCAFRPGPARRPDRSAPSPDRVRAVAALVHQTDAPLAAGQAAPRRLPARQAGQLPMHRGTAPAGCSRWSGSLLARSLPVARRAPRHGVGLEPRLRPPPLVRRARQGSGEGGGGRFTSARAEVAAVQGDVWGPLGARRSRLVLVTRSWLNMLVGRDRCEGSAVRGRRLVGVDRAAHAALAERSPGPKPLPDRLCLQGIPMRGSSVH